MKYILSLLMLLSISLPVLGQSAVPMADVMRDNGKIYVVVAVVMVVLLALLAYLVRLDWKITHLEKETDKTA